MRLSCFCFDLFGSSIRAMCMNPLPLLAVVAVKVLRVVTPSSRDKERL